MIFYNIGKHIAQKGVILRKKTLGGDSPQKNNRARIKKEKQEKKQEKKQMKKNMMKDTQN